MKPTPALNNADLNRRVVAQLEPLPAEGEVADLRAAMEAANQARDRLLATPHGRSRAGERSAASLQTAIGDLERQAKMMERSAEALEPGGTVRMNVAAGHNGVRQVDATFLGVDPSDGWIVLGVEGETQKEHRLNHGGMYGLFWEERVRIERWLADQLRDGRTTLPARRRRKATA